MLSRICPRLQKLGSVILLFSCTGGRETQLINPRQVSELMMEGVGERLPYCFLLDQSSYRNIILLRPNMWSVLGKREGFIAPVSQNAAV